MDMYAEVSEIWAEFENENKEVSSLESQEMLEKIKRNAENRLVQKISDLSSECANVEERQAHLADLGRYVELFSCFLREKDSLVDWDEVKDLPPELLVDVENMQETSNDIVPSILGKLVVVKLNGGLGTKMGCKGPKSAIPVKNGLTFLDLTIQQIATLNQTYNVNVPLVLMNSFKTDKETQHIIRNYPEVEIKTFQQSCFPRISKDTLLPFAESLNVKDNIEAWYPPGHGEFYEMFKNSGLLKRFLEEGREYCFISNIDNLGGSVNINILNFILNFSLESRPEFLMEVKEKTKFDVKGGTLIQYKDKLRLLEIAQVSKDHVKDFKSLKYFNTNNLWVKLEAIDRIVSDGSLNMEIIVNPKTIFDNKEVIQLETAVGAAMKCFERVIGVKVPSSRFMPVKQTADLMIIMSDIFKIDGGYLSMNPARKSPHLPVIKLDDQYFAKFKDFLGRFPTIPDILDLDDLSVEGNVTFGNDVILKGTVDIFADHGDRIDIPPGSILDNKVVVGGLSILDS